MAQASRRCVTAAAASAANLQLVRRDALLNAYKLREEYVTTARVAPFSGSHVIGPDPREFNRALMNLKTEHTLHQGLSSHFKVPTKPAPKSAVKRTSVHQRLGPSVETPRQPFRGGEQRDSSSAAPAGRGSGSGSRKRGSRGAKPGKPAGTGSAARK